MKRLAGARFGRAGMLRQPSIKNRPVMADVHRKEMAKRGRAVCARPRPERAVAGFVSVPARGTSILAGGSRHQWNRGEAAAREHSRSEWRALAGRLPPATLGR